MIAAMLHTLSIAKSACVTLISGHAPAAFAGAGAGAGAGAAASIIAAAAAVPAWAARPSDRIISALTISQLLLMGALEAGKGGGMLFFFAPRS